MNTRPRLINRDALSAGANTHLHWGKPNTYLPADEVADRIAAFGLHYIRERWDNNANGTKGFTRLAEHGVGLYFTIGAMDSKPDHIVRDVSELASSPLAEACIGICGPNEPNKSNNDTWPGRLATLQETLFTEVRRYSELDHVPVSAGALKVNVKDLVGDAGNMVEAGVTQHCDRGDFHWYPGKAGPVTNARVARDWARAFPGKQLWQSETGWTTADTAAEDQARWVCEAILRNSLDPLICGTTIYEAIDEHPHVAGREGWFGPDWTQTTRLLVGQDYFRDFPGWLAEWADGSPYDGDAVCTSQPDGWTLYLLGSEGSKQSTFTLVMPPGYTCDLGEPTKVGSEGNHRWIDVPIKHTMTTIEVHG